MRRQDAHVRIGNVTGLRYDLCAGLRPETKLRRLWRCWPSFYRPVCNAAPPAPIIYFHGTADPVVPYEGGKVAGSPARSITARVTAANQNMADWANHNGCPQRRTSATWRHHPHGVVWMQEQRIGRLLSNQRRRAHLARCEPVGCRLHREEPRQDNSDCRCDRTHVVIL